MSSEVIIMSDILDRDFYVYDNGEDAINEIREQMDSTNTCMLYVMWSIGKFLKNDKLSTQYGMKLDQVAEALNVSVKTLRRYKTIANSITSEQLKRLAQLHVSGNAILTYAAIASKDKEGATKLLDGLLSGDIMLDKDVDKAYIDELLERNKPYNLLPGGEPPQTPELFSDIEDDLQEADRQSTNPGDALAAGKKSSDDYSDDADDDEEPTQYSADTKALLSKAKPIVAALRRDYKNITEDMAAQYERLEDIHSVVMGNADVSTELEDLVEQSYSDLAEVLGCAIKQLAVGYRSGYLKNPIHIDQTVLEMLKNGGILNQEE